MPVITPDMPPISAPEGALALDMLYLRSGQAAGTAVLNVSMDNGRRRLCNPPLQPSQFAELASRFSGDPSDTLTAACESLFAVGSDASITPDERDWRVGSYLGAYTTLTAKLDHSAYPPSQQVRKGAPGYIPDGFVSMETDSCQNASQRGYEMIRVDKPAILDHYKPLLSKFFTESRGSTWRDSDALNGVARAIFFNRQYSHDLASGRKSYGGGIVDLSKLSDVVCRHQALEFQVLNQVIGVKSLLFRCMAQFSDADKRELHMTNLVRMNGDWYVYDVTNPDYSRNGSWNPGIAPIPNPLSRDGGKLRYDVKMLNSGEKRTYDNEKTQGVYWFIQ